MPEYNIIVQDINGNILAKYPSGLSTELQVHGFLDDLVQNVQIARTHISPMYRIIVLMLA